MHLRNPMGVAPHRIEAPGQGDLRDKIGTAISSPDIEIIENAPQGTLQKSDGISVDGKN